MLSVQHLFRDAQDSAESKLRAIRLSMNINEMLSLYQMELSDKYSGCQEQKIVNLSHIPWQQRGNLLLHKSLLRNCTAVGYLFHVVRKLTFGGNHLPLGFLFGVFFFLDASSFLISCHFANNSLKRMYFQCWNSYKLRLNSHKNYMYTWNLYNWWFQIRADTLFWSAFGWKV